MADPQKLLQDLTDEFQAIQKDLTSVIEARQKLDSQLQENKAVQKEFQSLDTSANIYKLIGTVLIKQDKTEATMNVDKRLEFIDSEIKRIETQLRELQEKQERKKIEVLQFQAQLQQQGTRVAAGG